MGKSTLENTSADKNVFWEFQKKKTAVHVQYLGYNIILFS